MRKVREIEESYECCDFCGTEICPNCDYPANHNPTSDWKGESDCIGWACKELNCCEKRFYQLELANAQSKLRTIEKRLSNTEWSYKNTMAKYEKEKLEVLEEIKKLEVQNNEVQS